MHDSLSRAIKAALSICVISLPLITQQVYADHQKQPEENDTGQQSEQPVRLPGMVIEEGERISDFDRSVVRPRETPYSAPDSARMMMRVPGGNISDNGPLSSQVQYRGMFGPRMNVVVDGMHMNQGGPNWMDPPLHYIPRPLLGGFEVQRGIASVSSGGQTIGGTVRAYSKQSRFTNSSDFEFHGSLEGSFGSVDDGFAAGGIVYASNNQHRIHIIGSTEDGDDMEFGDGVINGTEYERHHYGLGYGFTSGDHEFSVDYRHTDTDDTGTPALPMDISFFDTDMFKGGYQGTWGDFHVSSHIHYSSIDHGMNNFTLRPAPNFNPTTAGPDPRFVLAESDQLGFNLTLSTGLLNGEINFGADGEFSDHDMEVGNPNNPNFFVTQFNSVDQNRFGFFAEWLGELGGDITGEFGLRYNHVEMSAGEVDSTPSRMLPPPMRLRDRFNAADRKITDNNVDWVIKFQHNTTENLKFELGAARKTRSPSYIERFLWLPLEVTAGLADGNNYVGNLELDPEVAHEIEFGFSWTDDRFHISPRIFYKRVKDFIQGTAATIPEVIGVSTLNGDSTPLRFNNVKADYVGFDLEMDYQFTDNLHAEAIISYVRGNRRDIDDPLYRIAPPNATISLNYQREDWGASAEVVGYDKGDRISQVIVGNEPRTSNEDTDSYGIFNLYGYWRPMSGLTFTAGLYNLFDKNYISHLNGFNRNMASDVAVGQRLPGAGRNAFIRTRYDF